jgi:hypothetical protein
MVSVSGLRPSSPENGNYVRFAAIGTAIAMGEERRVPSLEKGLREYFFSVT